MKLNSLVYMKIFHHRMALSISNTHVVNDRDRRLIQISSIYLKYVDFKQSSIWNNYTKNI